MQNIKKVAEIWVTPETMDKIFPKSCIVNCKIIEMTIDSNFPILLRPRSKIKYEVFSYNREIYNNIIQKLQIKGLQYAN